MHPNHDSIKPLPEAPRVAAGPIRQLGELLALAVAYFIAAKLALLLAIPPGYATAVWPAAGLALAVLLLRGNQLWLGVALGSFLANAATSFDATNTAAMLKSLALPAGLGLGAAAQALVGAWLVRRFAGFPNPLIKEQAVLKFLWFGGPVGCLVGATVGVASLGLAGVIPWAGALFSWWTWWIGDTIGTLIFAPLIVLWATKPTGASRRRPLAVSLPMVVMFALTVVFFVYVSAWERSRIRLEFAQRADNLSGVLQKSFDRYLEMLRAIESFYAAETDVDGQKFHRLVEGFVRRHPGVQVFSWNPRVRDVERAEFEAAARRDGFGDFEIRELDTQNRLARAVPHPEYVVVRYVEPLRGNEAVLGFNSMAEVNRLSAFNRARDTGEPVATGRIFLVQDAEQLPSILFGVPIYRNGLPHDTVEQRREHLLGFAVGVFRVGDMIAASLQSADRKDIEIVLRDLSAPPPASVLYDDRAVSSKTKDLPADLEEAPEDRSMPRQTSRFEMAGRQWALSFSLSPDYLVTHRSWQAWSVLAGGLLFTGLLGAFMLVITGRTESIESQVVERTLALRASEERLSEVKREAIIMATREKERGKSEQRLRTITDHLSEGLVIASLEGQLLHWNEASRAMFGFSSVEEGLRKLPEFVDTFEFSTLDGRLLKIEEWPLARVIAGERLYDLELRLRRLGIDRQFVFSFSGAIVREEGGKAIAFLSFADITERKATEEALAQLNRELEGRVEARTREVSTANLALRANEALLSEFVAHAPAAIAMLDTQMCYLQASERWLTDYKLGGQEIVGRSHYEVFPDIPDSWKQIHQRVLGGAVERCDDDPFPRADGGMEWLQWEARPWRKADGSIGGLIFFTQVITARKQLELQLLRQKEQLERSNRDLEQFAYVASHDLQEPLRAVAGCGQILQRRYRDKLDGEANELIEHIVEGAGRMQTLILDLLAYSRVGIQGKAFAPADSADVFRQALANLATAIKESGATVTAGPLPPVRVDPAQLTQLFQNLVGNALKYRSARPPEICVEASRGEGEWKFSVRDNGIGIEPKYFERIFLLFQRLHTRSEYPGTGIGLALCQKIVERHGGRIWVESVPGDGSVFYFSIPIETTP